MKVVVLRESLLKRVTMNDNDKIKIYRWYKLNKKGNSITDQIHKTARTHTNLHGIPIIDHDGHHQRIDRTQREPH